MNIKKLILIVAIIAFNSVALKAAPTNLWKNTLILRDKTLITVKDTSMYRKGELVELSALDGSNLRLFTVVTNTVKDLYSGKKIISTKTLNVGYYFIESQNDRAAFVVLPSDWKPSSWFGSETMANVGWDSAVAKTWTNIQQNIYRDHGNFFWKNLQNNETLTNTADWNWFWGDQSLERARSNATIIISSFVAPDYYATNSPTIFYEGYDSYVEAILKRYKSYENRLYFEVWNEPWVDSIGNYKIPFERVGCVAMDWNSPTCGQAYTNWMNAYCDLVQTTEAVRVRLGSKVKLAGPTTCNLDTYFGLMETMTKRGLTNIISAFTWHDYDDKLVPSIFTDVSWNIRPGQSLNTMLQHFRKLVGNTVTNVFIDEFGTGGRSAITDKLYASQPPEYYNSGKLDWQESQNLTSQRILTYLGNGITGIIPHVFVANASGTDFEKAISLYGWEYGCYGLKPKTASLLMIAHLTNKFKPVGIRVVGNHCYVAFVYSTNYPKYRIFVWAKEGTSENIILPKGVYLQDLFQHKLLPTVTEEVKYFDLDNDAAAPLILQALP